MASMSEPQPSRHLPPAEAWKQPDKWIDLKTGLARIDAPRFYLETDDRGFVMPAAAVQQIKDEFFCSDYDWVFNKNDPETCPDPHHFHHEAEKYSAESNGGSTIPKKFRELPTMIGLMPRQFHNTIHDFTYQPLMPDMDAMKDYINSYHLAYTAFRQLYESAGETVWARRQFRLRRESLQSGRVVPKDDQDIIGRDIMRTSFAKSFASYSEAIGLFNNLDNRDLIDANYDQLNTNKPDRVV